MEVINELLPTLGRAPMMTYSCFSMGVISRSNSSSPVVMPPAQRPRIAMRSFITLITLSQSSDVLCSCSTLCSTMFGKPLTFSAISSKESESRLEAIEVRAGFSFRRDSRSAMVASDSTPCKPVPANSRTTKANVLTGSLRSLESTAKSSRGLPEA